MSRLARALLLVPFLLVPGAGSACNGGTGSGRFSFPAAAAGIERDPAAPFAFTNDFGWNVTLSKATLTFGPLYLNTVAPLAQQQQVGAWWPRFLGVREARASENSHLGEGRIVGEILSQLSVDLLSPSLVPFADEGLLTEEQIGSAEVWFYPPPGAEPSSPKIEQPALTLAGVAEREGASVAFAGRLFLDDTWLPDASPGSPGTGSIEDVRQVRGIPCSFFPRAKDNGTLQIRIDARALLAGADFSNLSQSPLDPADGTSRLLVQSTSGQGTDQVMKALYNGLRASRGTYDVRWVPAP
jgi:hypothetical protein